MSILEERYWYPRDYLMPMYPCGLEDLDERRPATYDDFVVMTRVVYARLRECFFDEGRWVAGRGPLLLPELYKLWTEHSERNWIVSMAAASGIPREERQMLGRWAVKESSDEYIRSAQRIVARIQCTLLEKLRADREWDLRNSGLDEVKEYITKIKYDADSISGQMYKLEMPEAWTPVAEDEPHQSPLAKPHAAEPEEPGQRQDEPQPEESKSLKEVMEVREEADDVGSEEDDVDAKGKFFVAINVRSRHRKLHIWGSAARSQDRTSRRMNRMIASREFSLTPFVAIAGRAKTLKKLRTARRRQVRATLTEGKNGGREKGSIGGGTMRFLYNSRGEGTGSYDQVKSQ
jgi:hypothetical protein